MEAPWITTTLRIGGRSYLVDPEPISQTAIPSTQPLVSSPVPVTVLNFGEDIKIIKASTIKEYLASYLSSDDVISEEFFSSLIILVKPGRSQVFEGPPSSYVEKIQILEATVQNPELRGPYFLLGEKLHKVYRLFPDTYGAFVSGILSSTSSDQNFYHEAPTHDIPVPSRLYFPEPTQSQPLRGKRIVVKDIYDIRGLKTGGGSKAYLSLQEKASKTAHVIQTLVDQGAVIIGKTKTSHMVSGVAPRDWIDYQCPFNPRGDGYLDPDCSSSGSGAAIAGYEWIDCAIGSDSLGSMVGPASAGGTYGIRVTQGVLSNEGAVAVSGVLDTPGHFCRDIDSFSLFAKHWILTQLQLSPAKVTEILVVKERFQEFKEAERLIMEDFVKVLETILEIPSIDVDIEAIWNDKAPKEHSIKSLKEYLSTTLATIQLYDSYHNNLAFRAQYKEHFGYEPAIDEIVRYKWNLGSKITKEEYDAARVQRETFKSFMVTDVVQEGTLLILPGGMPWVQYRDTYPGDLEAAGRPWQGYGFTTTSFSSLGGLPCVSVPVGQSKYHSKITDGEEVKPVNLWMLGAPGTDQWLIGLLVHVIKASGRPASVMVGKTAF